MDRTLDLSGYFARIGWDGSSEPTYATLAGLLEAHTARIPFENFDVLLGRKIGLDLDALQAKLVQARRGGYCFEHASLFAALLEALGFAVVRHAARVTVFQRRSEAPRSHMFLTVSVDGRRYVVDPGFGVFGSRLPVPLDGTGVPAERPTHRIAHEGEGWVLYAVRDGREFPAWVSTLEAENPVDFEMANHFIATHAASPFVNRIMASAITRDGRVNLMNRDVTVVRDGAVSTAQLGDRRALRELIAKHFGFDLAEAESLRVPSEPDWA